MVEKIIAYSEANQRVDKYVRKLLHDAPLSFIYKLFRKKDVKINGKPVSIEYKIQENDQIRVYVTDCQMEDFGKRKEQMMSDMPFPIIYEDENVLMINKPTDILVHNEDGETREDTLTDYVLRYLAFKNEYNPRIEVGYTPGPVHRLDRHTTGLVVFGKNIQALQELNQLFRDKDQIEKHYLTLVRGGNLKRDGEINAPIFKNEKLNQSYVSNLRGAKDALTKYWVIKNYREVTLLDVQIITGRTHQIRVHMSYIKHPVVNDAKYGDFDFNRRFKDLFDYGIIFLHAHSLKFKKLEGVLSYLSNQTFEAPLDVCKDTVIKKLNATEE